jgi:inosine/xanthosine triphosphate pyrophosphatase family protein
LRRFCKEIGENGFGYDPIFYPDFDRLHTFGEISPEIKNKKSHRARACNELSYWLFINKIRRI